MNPSGDEPANGASTTTRAYISSSSTQSCHSPAGRPIAATFSSEQKIFGAVELCSVNASYVADGCTAMAELSDDKERLAGGDSSDAAAGFSC